MTGPPPFCEWLLRTTLPPGDHDAVAGDLCEEFLCHVVPTRGVTAAVWWYRLQVARSIVPLAARSWQRASTARAAAAVTGAAAAAVGPAVLLVLVRTFVLQQVPLKTTPELSATFGVLLGAVLVAGVVTGVLSAVRVLNPREGSR